VLAIMDVLALIAQRKLTVVLIKHRKIYVIFIKIIIIVTEVETLKNTVSIHVEDAENNKSSRRI